MRSFHPRCFFGQPSASAIGFQVAMTSGDKTTGSPAGEMGVVCPALESQERLSTETYAPDAGLKTCGLSSPERIEATASPDPMARASMCTRRPPATAPELSNFLTDSSIHDFFSLP